ncbi:hypothetical protein TNCV_179751 [Trichonephila clavipes]|nr:hypothetical protein TNCV_179751 [Trichonephila clavipes]
MPGMCMGFTSGIDHGCKIVIWSTFLIYSLLCHPSGIVVSDADCFLPQGLGSNSREGKEACKGIVPLRHGDTLNSPRAASPLMRLVNGEERWEAPDPPRVFSFKIGVGPSQITLLPVWCSRLRLTTGVHLILATMNFVGLDLTHTKSSGKRNNNSLRKNLKPFSAQ